MSRLQTPQAKDSGLLRLLRAGIISGIFFAVFVPFTLLVLWSFGLRFYFPELIPTEFSLRAWAYLASPSSKIFPSLVTSLLLSLSVTVLAILIALPAGRAFGLYRFRAKTLLELLMLAPVTVPGLAVVMGIQVLFIRYGLADSFLGVVIAQLIPVTPYAVRLLAGVFANYEVELEAQARMLGATPLKAFWFVTLPEVLPGMVVSTLFAFLVSWSEYILTLLIGGGKVMTLPLLLFSLAQGGDYALTAATSLVFIAPAIVVLLVGSRFLANGLRA